MKSRTADLFAETDASPARIPASPSLAPSTPALTPASAPTPPRAQRSAPRVLKAGGVPPTRRQLAAYSSKQLWYAVVFPELVNVEHSAAVLQRLCLHAQRFTSFVSIEPPNALLLEIKGSLKLFGPLERLHADIDACWRRRERPAHSATAPSTLAALWLARGGHRAPHSVPATLSSSKTPERCPGTWRSCRLLVRPGISNGCRLCAPWV